MRKETQSKTNTESNLFFYYSFTEKDVKKYPVITKILKQLTPNNIQKVLIVGEAEFPIGVKKIVEDYPKIGDPARNMFLWKWIFRGTKTFTGNQVNKKFLSDLLEVKLLLFILDTFYDDVVDKPKVRSKELTKEILKVPFQQRYIEFDNLTQKEKKCVKFAIKIWNKIEKKVRKFPKYKEFRDIFEYDIYQFLNTIRYCHLVHQNNYLLNTKENWLYLPHAMQAILNITLELMCMPNFNNKELGILRKIAWHVQNMSRIGNWVSTWEREIDEKEFTSAVFVSALDSRIITLDDLNKKDKTQVILRIRKNKIEKELLKEWEGNYHEIEKLSKKVKSFNVAQKLSALRKVIFFHLSSRGYK
jgi:hypothetical protein